jgi:hypothetical protein
MFQAPGITLPLKQSRLRASDHRNGEASVLVPGKAAASAPVEGEKIMTTTTLLLAAAIMAQPMLLLGIIIGGLIEDRRAG